MVFYNVIISYLLFFYVNVLDRDVCLYIILLIMALT